MKICVFGIWHLGIVTAVSLAEAGFVTIGLETDEKAAKRLSEGHPPLFEPGVEEVMASTLAKGSLSFTHDKKAALKDADIVWVTFDTPVDDNDIADSQGVCKHITDIFPLLKENAVLLISSQLPVGSTRILEMEHQKICPSKKLIFAYSPENLRLGKALEVFRHSERIVVGLREGKGKEQLDQLLSVFCKNILWMGVEAAELSKHAINAFLATCVTFINEIATVAEKVGADPAEVERALRSEPRIGAKAYIRPGAAFAGGTLARDIRFLSDIGRKRKITMPLINSVLPSNEAHSFWPFNRLKEQSTSFETVTILGLSYKPGTDTLRRSLAIELIQKLLADGTKIKAFDPSLKNLPASAPKIALSQNLESAVTDTDAVIVMTEWPEFRALSADQLAKSMKKPFVIDQNKFLGYLDGDPRIDYLFMGKVA